jgi:hypothetical protein
LAVGAVIGAILGLSLGWVFDAGDASPWDLPDLIKLALAPNSSASVLSAQRQLINLAFAVGLGGILGLVLGGACGFAVRRARRRAPAEDSG